MFDLHKAIDPVFATDSVLNRLDVDESFRRQLIVKTLSSKLTPMPLEVTRFLAQLAELCDFEAQWRDPDDGWAHFLDEVATALEKVDRATSLAADVRLKAILEAAEESSHQMDDCYSCDIEVERISKIFKRRLV